MLLIDLKVMTMNSSELKLLYLTYIYLKFKKYSALFFFQKQLKPTMMTHVRNVVLFFHTFFLLICEFTLSKKSIYCDNTKSITMANIYGAKYWKSLSNYVL